MKSTLEFNLPEDSEELSLALNAQKWWNVVYEMDQYLRGKIKHGHEYKTVEEALEDNRKKILELMTEEGIDF